MQTVILMSLLFASLSLTAWAAFSSVLAEETTVPGAVSTPAASALTTEPSSEGSTYETRKTPKKTSRKASREATREAEGTEAPDRFKAETVIKSQYQLHGQPLEVDPD